MQFSVKSSKLALLEAFSLTILRMFCIHNDTNARISSTIGAISTGNFEVSITKLIDQTIQHQDTEKTELEEQSTPRLKTTKSMVGTMCNATNYRERQNSS